MFRLHAFAPGFLLGLVTVAVLAVEPARGPEPATGETVEAAGEPTAIPGSQRDVEIGDFQSTTFTTFVNIPNSQVTIDNGTSTRNVVVTFSADAHVTDPGDIFQLGFRIDSGSCDAGGPSAFTASTLFETRTAVNVFTIGPGTHTIRPCWGVFADGDGAQAIELNRRSLIAEGRTK